MGVPPSFWGMPFRQLVAVPWAGVQAGCSWRLSCLPEGQETPIPATGDRLSVSAVRARMGLTIALHRVCARIPRGQVWRCPSLMPCSVSSHVCRAGPLSLLCYQDDSVKETWVPGSLVSGHRTSSPVPSRIARATMPVALARTLYNGPCIERWYLSPFALWADSVGLWQHVCSLS